MKNTLRSLAVLSVLVLALAGCSSQQASKETPASDAGSDAAVAVDTTNAVTTDANGTRVRLFVTDAGFVPSRVSVPAGQPVTLVVTRTTDHTCATELVLKEHNIHQALPMNQAVEIAFTPAKPGELTYACGMDMIKGVIAVQ